MKLWIVIANSSSAEIFLRSGRSIQKVHHLDFPAGRLKSSEILADRPGRSFESFGAARHAYSSETSIHSQEQQLFAHQLAAIMLKASEDKTFDRLAIIAPPEFLGQLRRVLPTAVTKFIYREINKDMPDSLSEPEKIETICRLLDLPAPVPLRKIVS